MDLEIPMPTRLKPLFLDKERHQVIVAHRRWAKTLYSVNKCVFGTDAHAGAITKSGGVFWLVFPTYKQGKMAAWKMLKDVAMSTNRVKSVNETERYIKFNNDSEIHIKGSDQPDSLRGGGLDGLCLDEYAIQKPEIWSEILRSALADKRGWSVKTSTPKGQNHFYNDYLASGKKWIYPADTSGVIPLEELEEIKKELSIDEYAQEMLCQFLYKAGQIYTEFKPELHVIEPREVKGLRKIAVDYGLRNPTAVLFATIDYDGNTFITDEIYESGLEIQEIARQIRDMWHDNESVNGVVDPSTAAKDRFKNGIPYSVYQEFIENNISLTLAPNSVLAGINLVKQMFTNRKLFIFSRCTNLINELGNYRWREKRAVDSNLPEEPLKVDDHAVDALKYLIASQFTASEMKAPKEQPHENSIAYHMQKNNWHKNKRKDREYAVIGRN